MNIGYKNKKKRDITYYIDELKRPLCLCEYINRHNKRSHILMCCCNCDRLDELCTNLLCCRFRCNNNKNKNKVNVMNEAILDIMDRIRIPYLNGAVRLDINLLITILAIATYFYIGTSFNIQLTIFMVILIPTFLYIRFFQLRFFQSSSLSTSKNKLAFYVLSISLLALLYIYEFKLNGLFRLHDHFNYYYLINKLLFLTAIVLHICLHVSNPGRLKPSTIASNRNNSDSVNDNYCNKCNLYKYDKYKIGHCPICSACIYERDQHCFFIDNCVGYLNNKAYFLFLLFLYLTFVYTYSFIILFINYNLIGRNSVDFILNINSYVYNGDGENKPYLIIIILQLTPILVYLLLLLLQNILLISIGYTQRHLHIISKQKKNYSLILFILDHFKVQTMFINFTRFFKLRRPLTDNIQFIDNYYV